MPAARFASSKRTPELELELEELLELEDDELLRPELEEELEEELLLELDELLELELELDEDTGCPVGTRSK